MESLIEEAVDFYLYVWKKSFKQVLSFTMARGKTSSLKLSTFTLMYGRNLGGICWLLLGWMEDISEKTVDFYLDGWKKSFCKLLTFTWKAGKISFCKLLAFTWMDGKCLLGNCWLSPGWVEEILEKAVDTLVVDVATDHNKLPLTV